MLNYPGTTEIILRLAAIRDGRQTDLNAIRDDQAMAEHYQRGWDRDARDFSRLVAEAKAAFLAPRDVVAAAVDHSAAAVAGPAAADEADPAAAAGAN